MKNEVWNLSENKVMIGVMAGFASLLVLFKILGSSFNELLTLSLFFMVITIIIASALEQKERKKKS
jgi:phage shock protein PspC (stress-responsive transcriptional regulator)